MIAGDIQSRQLRSTTPAYANDRAHLDRITAIIPSDALVISYLDPEGLDLNWETIRWLAWRYKRLDLLINLPVPAVDRCLATGTPANVAHAARVLGHPAPRELCRGAQTRTAIREWFKQQLRELGYKKPAGHEIHTESKHVPRTICSSLAAMSSGGQLYNRANAMHPAASAAWNSPADDWLVRGARREPHDFVGWTLT